MRNVLIVGAGQAGLQLALGLQAHGYDVTVVSERTPDEMRAGRVTSTQVLFPSALATERESGLGLWDTEAPTCLRTGFTIPGPDGAPVVDWLGDMGGSESVDQRVKMPAWLELFGKRGGKVVFRRLTVPALDAMAARYDLVVIAAGRGELAELFERDAARSAFDRPQRHLAVTYLHGSEPRPTDSGPSVHLNVIPEIGEMYFMPGLTLSGPCEIVLVEALPGKAFDVFPAGPEPAHEQWARTRELIRTHVPWEAERTRRAEPTDDRATLTGSLTPIVRRPVAELPSGRPVLGIGDAVVTNDPIAGQGANNACWAAKVCLGRIIGRGDLPFDSGWMRETGEDAWSGRTGPSVAFTNALLMPPPDHLPALMVAGNVHPEVADRIARAIDRVEDLGDFFYDAGKACAYLEQFS
jgi:NAD(P)-dependent dehydrogenase (short-subunit alcohol dehydrogenase family)